MNNKQRANRRYYLHRKLRAFGGSVSAKKNGLPVLRGGTRKIRDVAPK